MPFLSKSQMRACFATKNPKWNCKEWASATPNIKGLPERLTGLASRLWKRRKKFEKKK